ncbi:MAG: hypothetical protein KAS36_12530, partial [Anaerolineales bacterium]|nr:hypothetical protein [Anaerolineales bacterium]
PEEGVFAEMPGLGYGSDEDRYLVLGAFGGAPDLHGQYVLPDRTIEGDPFLIDSSAIQNVVASQIGEDNEFPAWLAVWNYQGDIHGKVFPDTPMGDIDSDLDGLTDSQELAGFTNQFGQIIVTDPFKADSDADGIPDGDEIGVQAGGVYLMLSDPNMEDTDSDGVEDFVELYSLPEPTLPRDPDTDGDGLTDGEEVNEYSTDPWLLDTDGDEQIDGDEVADDSDPLISNIKLTAKEVAWQFAVGAVGGDFYIDDSEYGTIPFLLGLLISGALSAIPLGFTQVLGFFADGRDLAAAFKHGDLLSFGVIALSLIPLIGDPSDIVGTIGRFIGRYPKLAGELAVILVRMDPLWRILPEADQLNVFRKIWSDEIIDALLNKGFDSARIVDLTKAGVDLRHLAPALDEIAEQFPGLIAYLKKIPIDGEGILRGNGLTANLKGLSNAKRLDNARSLASYLGNIKGAYTQVAMKAERIGEGFEIVRDLRHVNAAGYDLVLRNGGITRILEAKSGLRVSLGEIKNYIRKIGDQRFFDVEYFTKWFNQIFDEQTTKALLRSGEIEIEFFINNPRSAEIASELLELLGGNTAKYFDDLRIEHTINIIITAVTK